MIDRGPFSRIRAWPWLVELGIVLWVSLGASAVRALLNLLNRLTVGVSLSDQTASIVVSQAPDRPWLDLAYQMSGIVIALGPVALVWYLLRRSGTGFGAIGLDTREPGRDLRRGLVLGALVGTVGLGLYLAREFCVANQAALRYERGAPGERHRGAFVILPRSAEAQ